MCKSPPMRISVETDDDAGDEADARHDIHGKLQRVRNTRLSWTVRSPYWTA